MDLRKNPPARETLQHARRIRREPTGPEHVLWMRLQAGQLAGLHFRRQPPVGPYVVDFYCASAKLGIELDGFSHDERAAHDERRTEFLAAAGIRVVRFANDEVLHVDAVLHVIACACGLEV